MRAIFGLLSLLLVLVMVGTLAKKQLSSLSSSAPVAVQNPAAADPAITLPKTTPGATPQQQSLQIQQQIKQNLEKSLQQAHPVPEDQ